MGEFSFNADYDHCYVVRVIWMVAALLLTGSSQKSPQVCLGRPIGLMQVLRIIFSDSIGEKSLRFRVRLNSQL